MTTNESRPVGAAPEAWLPEAIVLEPADIHLYLDGYDTGEAVGRTLGYADGHVAGYDKGTADGHEQALAEAEADLDSWRDAMVRRASALAAAAVPYDQLAERRGQPERAARQRELLRANGVTR